LKHTTREIKPDAASPLSKKEQVEEMFNQIAPRYDLLNSLLSLGIDRTWRKKAIRSIAAIKPQRILDVATGTGALAIEALSISPAHVTGVDIADDMLEAGRQKLVKLGLEEKITLVRGDSENLRFESGSFDAVTAAFGVRNFGNLQAGLNEMHRVLKRGGMIAILEFSTPRAFPFRQFYRFYFTYILPLFGGMISNSRKAYTYLPESVKHFPEGNEFTAYLVKAGFRETRSTPLTFGICTLYNAVK
jgi:demethylmenaquinone methyltransferase/2-methoxy-6-polyprenyl-1,4-benzoquinol methylase